MEQNHQFVEYPFDLQPENIVQDKSILLNTRIFDFVLKLYMAGLILQYIFIFALVPFDDIDNRPSICYASIIFCLVMVCCYFPSTTSFF